MLKECNLRMAAIAAAVAALGATPLAAEDIDQRVSTAQSWMDGTLADYNAPPVTYDGEPITMRMTHQVTEAHPMAKMSLLPAGKVLEKISNGKLKVEYRLGGTLHAAKEGIAAARNGIADFATCYVAYDPSSFHLAHLHGLPFLYPNATIAVATAEELYPQYVKDEYERSGVYLGRHGGNAMYSVWGHKPIRVPGDIAGLKIRAVGDAQAKIMESLGAVPTNIPLGNVYTALQRGLLDTAYVATTHVEAFKLWELVKHHNSLEISTLVVEYCMNPRWFDALPDDLKKVVYHWMRGWAQAEGQLWTVAAPEKAKPTIAEHGVETYVPTAEERKLWTDAVEPVVAEFIESNEAAGRPAKQFLKDAQEKSAELDALTLNELMQRVIDNPSHGIISGF